MSEWKSVEKDGMPTEDGEYLVQHDKFYCYSILANFYSGSFSLGAQVNHLPATLALEVTHYCYVPQREEEYLND